MSWFSSFRKSSDSEKSVYWDSVSNGALGSYGEDVGCLMATGPLAASCRQAPGCHGSEFTVYKTGEQPLLYLAGLS